MSRHVAVVWVLSVSCSSGDPGPVLQSQEGWAQAPGSRRDAALVQDWRAALETNGMGAVISCKLCPPPDNLIPGTC